jgi:hypothetical protein
MHADLFPISSSGAPFLETQSSMPLGWHRSSHGGLEMEPTATDLEAAFGWQSLALDNC